MLIRKYLRTALVLLLMATACASAQPENVVQTKQKLDALKSEIAAVDAVIDAKSQALAQSTQALKSIDLAISESARKLYQYGAQAKNTSLELEALSLQANELNESLRTERDKLKALLRSAYAIGQLEQIKLALAQEKIARIGRVLAYHEYINHNRVQAITAIQASLATLKALQDQITQKQVQLDALIQEQVTLAEALAQQRQARTGVIAKLNAELQTGNAKLEQLQADQDRLNTLLNRISDVLSDIPKVLPNAQLLPGRLSWPLRRFEVQLTFGERNERGKSSEGLLLSCANGAEVRTVGRGRVAFADWLRGFGLLVIVDHGDGLMSLYGELESVLISEGEWVDGETPIGLATDKVYFEWRKNGQPQNPLRWLRTRE